MSHSQRLRFAWTLYIYIPPIVMQRAFMAPHYHTRNVGATLMQRHEDMRLKMHFLLGQFPHMLKSQHEFGKHPPLLL